jgi:O-antigen/teichoic acid export membrane protein
MLALLRAVMWPSPYDWLRQRLQTPVMRAGGWTMLAYVFVQGTRILSSLIMTRLLVPEVFGIMAIAMVFFAALQLFSDIGLLQSVVRSSRGHDRAFLDTLWVLQILRGFAIWGAAMLLALGLSVGQSAGWIAGATVYAHPTLPHALAAIGLTAVLAGFESTKVAVARRDMALGPISRLEIVCNVVAVGTTIAWALVSRSIWALIGGWIVAARFRTILTHLALPGQGNRYHWDPSAAREILDFGKWVLVSSGLTFLVNSGDRLILGSLLSSQQLGIYSVAYLIVTAAQQGLSRLAVYVFFPLLSQVARNEPNQLHDSYYKARRFIDFSSLGLAGFLMAAGQSLVGILYDTRYAGAGSMLAVLALTLVGSRYEVAEQVFLALGKSRFLAVVNAVRVATLFVLVPVTFLWGGLDGAIWGVALASLLPALVTIAFCRHIGIFDLRRELSCLYALPLGFIVGSGAKWLLALAR